MRRPNRRWSLTLGALSVLALDSGSSHASSNEPIPVPPPPTVMPRVRTTGEDLYLEVVLNGSSTEKLVHFIHRGETLCALAGDLRGLGFILPPGDGERCLPDIEGLRYTYDVRLQRVDIQVPNERLHLPTHILNRQERPALRATSGTGVLLNYDIYAAHGGGEGNISGLAELRGFSEGLGVLSTTSLTRRYQSHGVGWRGDSVRLDTQWRLSFPDRAQVLTIGDTFTGYLAWTRATRIGGIAYGTDFATQPYRVTTPLPQFFGEATAPSSVELYVDGIRQYSGKVPAGPFQLTAVPGIDQAGQAQVVLTDALGRSSTVTFPFYAARQLLREGLDDWSVELGTVRRTYGIDSFSYGDAPVGSATWRHGVTDALTVESHAEGGDGRGTAGAGGVWNPVGAHVLNASLSLSRGGGKQYGFGYAWNGHYMNASIDTLRGDARYQDVAAGYGSPPPRVSDRALIGFNVRESSFGANLVRLRYSGQPISRYAGLFALRNVGRGVSLSASYNRNLDDASDRSFFIGVTVALDLRATLSASMQRDRERTFGVVDASRAIDGDGGFGWHVQGRSGADAGGLGEVGWLGNRGQLTVGASDVGPSSYSYADANGAIVLMGGHVFAARRIDDAFALVTTEGAADVPVLLENRRTGVTDSRGLLLVPRLNAYQDNRLAIDPLDLPADDRVQRVEATIAPADRSGVMVRFPVKRVRAALTTLVDESGAPLPLGSTVATGDGGNAIVGYDGMVYLDDLEGSTILDVDIQGGGHCKATLDYPSHARNLPDLGPLVCRGHMP